MLELDDSQRQSKLEEIMLEFLELADELELEDLLEDLEELE